MRGKPPVEMALPAEGPVHDLGAKRGVPRLQGGAVQRMLERDVGEGPIALHADEDAQRLEARLGDRTGAQHRAHAATSLTRSPGRSRAPRRKSSHAIAL